MVAASPRTSLALDLHEQISTAVQRERNATYRLAQLLRQLSDGRLFRELGFASLAEYARVEHGLQGDKARALLTLAGAMQEVPGLGDALRDGVIGWTKARRIATVATESNVDEWIAHARTASSRDLEALTRAAHRGDSVAVANGRADERGRLTSVCFGHMTEDEHALVERVLQSVRMDAGLGEDDFDRTQALLTIFQTYAAHAAAVRDGEKPVASGPRYQKVVYVEDNTGVADGDRGDVHDTDVAMADCDAEVVEMRPGHKVGHVTHTIPPATRRFVMARDRNTCRVPDCTNHTWMDVHHITPRSRGGTHHPDNLILLCATHHRFHHDGYLGIDHHPDGSTGSVVFTFAEPELSGGLHSDLRRFDDFRSPDS